MSDAATVLSDEENWQAIEETYRSQLALHGAPKAAVDHVCKVMRNLFFEHLHSEWFSLNAHSDSSQAAAKQAVEAVAEHFKQIVNQLFFEIIRRELRLYLLDHPDDN